MYSFQMFVVFHHKIFDEMYSELNDDDAKHLVLFGVNADIPKLYIKNSNKLNIQQFDKCQMIIESNLPVYDNYWQKNNYCQASAMWHIYKNNLYQSNDYIGLCQYDMKYSKTSIDLINKQLNEYPEKEHIFYLLVGQTGNYDRINDSYLLSIYNTTFNTSIDFDKIRKMHNGSEKIILLHTFVISTKMFQKLMVYFDHLMEKMREGYSANIDQACYTETAIALFLFLEQIYNPNIITKQLDLDHIWPKYHNRTIFHSYKRKINK